MTVVVCVNPPPVPVIVIVCLPSLAFSPTETVMVEVPAPGAAMELGLKVTFWALPSPVADKAIAPLKPPEIVVVMVEVPELPLATVIVVGDALIVKLAPACEVTVSVTVVVSVVLPEVPVTVMGYVPVAAVAATLIVMVEVPVPVIEPGLKPTVTPVGWPLADKVTAESNPPVTVLVMVEVPEAPCTIETELGEAERLNPAVAGPVSALIRALPFGLPQPPHIL